VHKQLEERLKQRDNEERDRKDKERQKRLDDLIAQNDKMSEKMEKREKEQNKRNDALVAENKNLAEQMKMNEEEQRNRNKQLADQNERLNKQIEHYQQQHEVQLKEMNKLLEELKKKKLNTFEDIENQDKQAKEALIRLAKQAKPFGMEGNNVALFGITSTGKSTMLNALFGEKVAKTGIGETTIKMASYKTKDFILWDIPGKNDEVSYMSMQYISFFKGLIRRLILVTHTLKENSSMMKLLDAIGLDYDIVVNKMDLYEEEDRLEFCAKIQKEKETIGLKGVGRIFFVSAKFPQQFPDWLHMVDYLTNPPH
jgi:GTP-binding protein EngB required for normal cell division